MIKTIVYCNKCNERVEVPEGPTYIDLTRYNKDITVPVTTFIRCTKCSEAVAVVLNYLDSCPEVVDGTV